MNVKIINVKDLSAPGSTGMASGIHLPKFAHELVTYEFKTGINFLPGEFQHGQWILPYMLTDKILQHKHQNNKITYYTKRRMLLNAESLLINNENVDFTEAYKKFFYVTFDIFSKRQLYKSTVAAEIKKECKKSGVEYKYVENIFSYQNDHFYEEIICCQRSHYYYVTAFGFAKGYKIFCYPWFTKSRLLGRAELLKKLHNIALENDLTMIIPVEDNLFVDSNVMECYGQKEVFDFDYNVVNIENDY